MRETSIKAECILVEVVLLEVVVEKEMRFSRDTFEDLAQTWRLVLEA